MNAELKKQLHEIKKSEDLVVIGLRGHTVIDRLLNRLLIEILPGEHKLEVGRLGFGLKVDLIIALGFLNPKERALYFKLNKIRNDLAHGLKMGITDEEAKDILNLLSDCQREIIGELPSEPLHVLRKCILLAIATIQVARTRSAAQRIRKAIALRRAEELLGEIEMEDSRESDEYDLELRRKMEEWEKEDESATNFFDL